MVLFSKQIYLLNFGDELAQSFGISVNFVRLVIMFLVALASGVTVASVGVVEEGTVDELFTQKTLKECFGLDVTLGCDTFTKKLMITGVKDA